MLCKLTPRFSDSILKVDADVKNSMLLLAESRELLRVRNGVVEVPTIEFRHLETQRAIFCSHYMREIPSDDFDSFVLNAIRFSFAFGVIMAEKWYCDANRHHGVEFLIDDVTTNLACEILDWHAQDYELLMSQWTDYFIQRIELNEFKEKDLSRELRGVLSMAQTIGTALCLKQYDIC